MSEDCSFESFEQVKDRLDEIATLVSSADVDLDEALALYEEAVKLGLKACDMSEQDALEFAARVDAEAEAAGDAAAAGNDETGAVALDDAQQGAAGSDGPVDAAPDAAETTKTSK